ncbi:MAG: SOS response-associated peptidase [Gammaproteobacteria bacterium]
MCGRLNISADPLARWLRDVLGATWDGADNPNAAPTETLTVLVRGEDGVLASRAMRWWLTPYWAKAPSTAYSMFNARSESVAKSPAFREPFRARRCVLPVSGYYEWSTREGAGRLPWYIHPAAAAANPPPEGGMGAADVPGLLLAGIYDHWQSRDGTLAIDSFAVITTAAHPAMRALHDRQPVMLDCERAARWLDPGAEPNRLALELFPPALPVPLSADPVSTRVNSARHKDSQCVTPIGPSMAITAAPPDARDDQAQASC